MKITRRHFLVLASAALPFASVRGDEPAADTAMKIHFLHHSTGGNLIAGAGGIAKMFTEYNTTFGTDYQFTEEWSSPSGNYPYDYYSDTFSEANLKKYTEQYNVLIWKHCFPGSSILEDEADPKIDTSRQSLEVYKLQYRALRDRFDAYPDTKFMVWTLPPLHRNATNADEARRATEFSAWVKTDFLTENGSHPNMGCFDFRGYVAGEDNFLKYAYEPDHTGSDSHPNQTANDTVCPLFFQSIIDFIDLDIIASASERIPDRFRVGPASPNPFNPSTAIEYHIPSACRVILTIHDTLGRTVAVLQDGVVSSGAHRAIWNGKDMRGNPAASGMYLFSLRAGTYRGQGKMTLLR